MPDFENIDYIQVTEQAVRDAGLCEGCPAAVPLLRLAGNVAVQNQTGRNVTGAWQHQIRVVELYGRLNRERGCEFALLQADMPRKSNETWRDGADDERIESLRQSMAELAEKYPASTASTGPFVCELEQRNLERMRNELFGSDGPLRDDVT